MLRLSNVAVVLLLIGTAIAVPSRISSDVNIETVNRKATFSDVPHKFMSEFKFDPKCPDEVVISNISPPVNDTATVPHSDIVEDGVQCSGQKRMTLVTEQTVRKQASKFPKAVAAIQKNRNAQSVVNNKRPNSQLLVGFDEGARTCGSNVYPETTFYFFIRETGKFEFTIKTETGNTSINIPADKRALLITGPNNRICLLTDPTTGGGQKVVVATAAPAPSPSPTPSKAAKSPPKASTAPARDANINTAPAEPVEAESPSPIPSNNGSDVNPAPTANATSTNPVCFPGTATVQLESGKVVPMTELRIGDRVRTGATSFSDVFLFTHRDAEVHAQFVRLVTASGRAVTLTKSHYIYANDALVSAGEVRIGDSLQLADGEVSLVSAIENMSADGLYNPQTIDGKLVVDGIVTSAYTTAVHPQLAHNALLAPLRFLYERSAAPVAALDALTRFISAGANTLAGLVPSGPASLTA